MLCLLGLDYDAIFRLQTLVICSEMWLNAIIIVPDSSLIIVDVPEEYKDT